ncbi:hypothetical protein WA026_023604 [Henosepilachna vigintioctopunctata]|uniref:C2 domain-containing protein n=1 Tax=Henosepilachna vigintioctopunctata TaxID=420089 RepID=A0AAW1U4W0_9CUCU
MSRKDEIEACETLRSMSEDDLCKTTNLVYKQSNNKCSCNTCLRYEKEDFNCDLMRSNDKTCCKNCSELQNQCQGKNTTKAVHNTEIYEYMKYVDCMKVTVQELVLNENANKKLNADLKSNKKIPALGNQTFFIEYELPFIFSVCSRKKNAKKVKSCIQDNTFVRLCARRLTTEAILFKQTSVHNIENVDHINLQGIEMKFRISCRMMKQKNATLLGCATFKFEKFYSTSSLTCIEELPIIYNDNLPIVVGKLRILLEMGYGKVYFGKEFIASLKESSESRSIEEDKSEKEEPIKTFPERLQKNLCQEEKKKNIESPNSKIDPSDKIPSTHKDKARKYNIISVDRKHALKNSNLSLQTDREKHILFGFLYIPEARYSKANISSFIKCKLFCQEDFCYSKLVVNQSNPIFNFCQSIPLVYHEEFLQKLRDNVMVIEFWEKFQTKDILLGLTKLPLQQFYFSYRNVDVTQYLTKNKLPIIASDWWESITNPYTDEVIGQVQILSALGTEQQIKYLKEERGFKFHTVRANFKPPIQKNKLNKNNKGLEKENNYKCKFIHPKLTEEVNFKGDIREATLNKKHNNTILITEDKAIQANVDMSSVPVKEDKEISFQQVNNLLNQIINVPHQPASLVEKSMVTENTSNEVNANKIVNEKKCDEKFKMPDNHLLPTTSTRSLDMDQTSFSSTKMYENAPPLVRSTSDLLNSLQAALSIPPTNRPLISANRVITGNSNQEPEVSKHVRTSFKAQVFIKQALHLPVRKRCRGKKLKNKMGKADDNVKPSCYVTFETMPGLDLKMTPLVPKCTSPKWNYKCDVFLPAELLYNNQKLLVFKVWRKSTNTTMVPNLQSDLVVGFATMDLTLLLTGFPHIQAWLNIVDFSSKCNGQINIHVTPLEDLEIFKTLKATRAYPTSPISHKVNETPCVLEAKKLHQASPPEEHEPDSELLSRALKRKFNELDEITQRLRLRLSYVTNDGTDDENDEVADEFERDINSLSIEDDFDMANFENECRDNNPQEYNGLGIGHSGTSSSCNTELSSGHLNSTSNISLMVVPTHDEVNQEFKHTEESLSILDRQLLEGKQRIDTLLGKLSLISGDANSFSSRYISGCSATNRSEPGSNAIDAEAILNDLDHHSRPNILATTSFDNDMFERIYEDREKGNASSGSTSTSTSVISNTVGFRAAPDGQGTFPTNKDK